MITEITPYGLTVKGAALQTKIQARKIPLEFVGIGIGDGYLPDNQPFVETAGGKLIDIDNLIHEIPTQTTAESGTRPKADLAAVYDTKDTDGNPLCMMNVIIQNGDNDTTHIREFIIYANDPDIGKIAYGYTNLGDSGMSFPQYDGKVHVSYDWDFPTYISNSANVNANITLTAGTPRDLFNATIADIYARLNSDIDCGTWDNEEQETVIDGGGYDNVTGEIIDGGDYSNTDGEIIYGGEYPE